MSVSLIVWLSIVGYLFLSFFVTFFHGRLLWVHCCKMARDVTEPAVGSLGPVVVFSGLQGSGKSTSAAGAATVQAKIYTDLAAKKLEEIRLKLYKIDFSELDALIKFCFDQTKYNTDYILLSIYRAVPKYKSVFSGNLEDGVNCVSKLDVLRDYIDASISVLKNNPVYFVGSQFYNHYNKCYAMALNHDSTAIKDRYLAKDYNLYRYSVIFEDETLLGSGNNQGWEREASEDPGVETYLQLIRHIGKSTVKYYMVCQDANRLSKVRRKLVNSVVDMQGFREVVTRPLSIWFCSAALSILRYFDRFLKDSLPPSFYAHKHQAVNPLRTAMGRLQVRLDRAKGFNYVKYDSLVYSSIDDYQRPPNECAAPVRRLRLYYPAVWCWGSLNTYEYSSVHDVLSYESRDCTAALDIAPQPTMASREAYAKQILRKRSSAASPSPPSSSSPPSPPSGTNDVSVIT